MRMKSKQCKNTNLGIAIWDGAVIVEDFLPGEVVKTGKFQWSHMAAAANLLEAGEVIQ